MLPGPRPRSGLQFPHSEWCGRPESRAGTRNRPFSGDRRRASGSAARLSAPAPHGVHADGVNPEKIFAEGSTALRPGLVQQTDQIVASHDLSLFVRRHFWSLRKYPDCAFGNLFRNCLVCLDRRQNPLPNLLKEEFTSSYRRFSSKVLL